MNNLKSKGRIYKFSTLCPRGKEMNLLSIAVTFLKFVLLTHKGDRSVYRGDGIIPAIMDFSICPTGLITLD